MSLDRIAAVKIFACTAAACQCFIVLMLVVAEGQVVHRALCRCQNAERTEQGIDNALRGLNVAGHNGPAAFGA